MNIEDVINEIEKQRNELQNEQLQYVYDIEDKQIKDIEETLNDATAKRNHKKVMFDNFQQKIDKLNQLEADFNDLTKEEVHEDERNY